MARLTWIYVYPLLLVFVFGVAIYEHVSATSLSLPLSPALTVLAVALPVLSFANTIALPAALIATESNGNGDPNHNRALAIARRRPLLIANILQGLHIVQFLLAVILATFFFATAAPSSVRSCVVGTAWQHLFASKNGDALRKIQDAFNCCGFNSVRDRAWPFAEDVGEGRGVACAERFGRTRSCAAPWTATLQRTAGIEGGLSVGVLVHQLALYLVAQWVNDRAQRQSRNQGHRQTGQERGGWARLFLPFVGGATESGEGDDGVVRPLLGGGRIQDNRDEGEAGPTGYVSEVNAADEQAGEVNGDGHGNGQDGERQNGESSSAGQGTQQDTSQYGSIAPHDAWRDE